MTTSRSGVLAAWAQAFFAGLVSLDQAVDAVVASDRPHSVTGLPDGPEPGRLQDALVAWRRGSGRVRAVLPVPGDVRGVPGPAPFRAAALDAGEAVTGHGFGLVPAVVSSGPSSAPPGVVWAAYPADPAPADHLSVADAQYDLTTAIRESASALRSAGALGRDADTAGLAAARRAGERLDLPPGFPPSAVALLAQAERMQAMLDLLGPAERPVPLRELATAVRRARIVGYNASSETATAP